MESVKYSKTQLAILDVLKDGLPHLRDELIKCLGDPLVERVYLNQHLARLRKLLRPSGEDIVCELLNRRISYRHVRLLASAVNGYH